MDTDTVVVSEGIEKIIQAIQRDPENPGLHLHVIRLFLEAKEPWCDSDRILHHARRAVILDGCNPETLRVAGEALAWLGTRRNRYDLWREGLGALRKALALCANAQDRLSLLAA